MVIMREFERVTGGSCTSIIVWIMLDCEVLSVLIRVWLTKEERCSFSVTGLKRGILAGMNDLKQWQYRNLRRGSFSPKFHSKSKLLLGVCPTKGIIFNRD